jgi:hypothetical protein
MMQIEEMIIRVPGLGEEEARVLGQEVAQQISARLPEGMGNRYIPNLAIQLSLSAHVSRSEMANAIAEQLLTQLITA